jgi:uncharacterized protein YbjT (DUF2867 family)
MDWTTLVTGATGSVGSEVVKQLSSAGQKVRAAVRTVTRVYSYDKLEGVELTEIDYGKPQTFAAAMAVKTLTDDRNSRHIGKAYTITGPEALSYSQVAEILSNATNKKISYVNVSEEDTRLGMKDMGWDNWLIDTTLQLFDLYRKGYASKVSSDVEEVLGQKPISSLQKTMRRLSNSFSN